MLISRIAKATASACTPKTNGTHIPEMRRADRLFRIVQFLRGRRLSTAQQLAKRLPMSERTIFVREQQALSNAVSSRESCKKPVSA